MVNRTLSCSTAVSHGTTRWTLITYEDIIKLNLKIRKDELFISWNKWKYIALGYFGNVKQGMLCCLKIILIPNNSSLDSFTIFIIKRTPIWFKETKTIDKTAIYLKLQKCWRLFVTKTIWRRYNIEGWSPKKFLPNFLCQPLFFNFL